MVNKYIKNLFILACHNRNTDEDLSKFANYTAKKKKKKTIVLKLSNIIKDFEKLNFLHTAYEMVNKKKRKRKTIKNCHR